MNVTLIRLYSHSDTRARVVACECGEEGDAHEVYPAAGQRALTALW